MVDERDDEVPGDGGEVSEGAVADTGAEPGALGCGLEEEELVC